MAEIYTVSQVNKYIHGLFEGDRRLRSISVQGELSNVKYHYSGHIYFTLKDGGGAIAGVMFAGYTAALSFKMKDGDKVVVTGQIGTYERDGKYQIYARRVEHAGEGELYERYERLRKELAEMGMFDEGYKQEIPGYVMTLGVVTAPTGAAVRDIIDVSKRRFPYIQIILYPAKVQGDGAAESICDGIRTLDEHGVDCIIVGRGGGSIEDLWAFNEESVARAIFNCRTPIISAVGHETDTTIADWVADLRVPTPSAAAELAVFEYDELMEGFDRIRGRLKSAVVKRLSDHKNICDKYEAALRLKSPGNALNEKKLRLDGLYDRLARDMRGLLDDRKRQAEAFPKRLKGSMLSRLEAIKSRELPMRLCMTKACTDKLTEGKTRLALLTERLNGLSPLLKLSQGYTMTEDASGRAVTSVKRLKKGDMLKINFKDGKVAAKVEDITENG